MSSASWDVRDRERWIDDQRHFRIQAMALAIWREPSRLSGAAISSSYHVDRQIRFALILLRNQNATSRRKAIITQHSTIGDKYGRKDLRKRRQVPVHGRPRRTHEPRLVAEPTR